VKNWFNINDKLNDHIELAIQLLLLMLGVYIFILAENQRLWKIPVLFVGLLIWFLTRKKTKHPILWIVFFMLLVLDLYVSYFWVANHHFLLIFMVLTVLFYSYHKRSDVLLKNIQMLLVVVLIASAMQKLMSNQFMDGNFYYYMISRGSMFSVFINVLPESFDVIKSNSESITTLYDSNPNNGKNIILKDVFSNLGLISIAFAWITVAVEFMVAIAILWKPRSTWTHLIFIMMIFTILCARLETGFIALLAICGLFLCSNAKLRSLYIVIVMGCISLVVTKIGYH
tara:strand:+ start:795 stop:1649 length:855 start_codon:yes stop_codon:yes gene_type:complete